MKRLLFLLALSTFCIFQFSEAQRGLIRDWKVTLNAQVGDPDVSISDSYLDSQGNQYVSGSVSGPTGIDFYFVKYNSSGTKLWEQFIDSNPNEDSGARQILEDGGNFYVSGRERNGQSSTLLIAKFDASGNLQWTYRYTGPHGPNSSIFSMKIHNGALFFIGQQDGPSYANAIIGKIQLASGTQDFVKEYDDGEESALYSFIFDASGNIYAAGNRGSGFLAVKFDSSINDLWVYPSPGAFSDDVFTDIYRDASGNIYLSGREEAGNGSMAILTKLNSSGNLQWTRKKGDTWGFSVSSKVFEASNGNLIIVCAMAQGFDEYVKLYAYDAFGTLRDSVQFAAGKNAGFSDILVDGAGNTYVLGFDYGGNSDTLFVVKFSQNLGITWSYTEARDEYPAGLSLNGNRLAFSSEDFNSLFGMTFLQDASNGNIQSSGRIDGQKTPNSRPFNTHVVGSDIYVSTTNEFADSSIYILSKYDASGNLLWEGKETEKAFVSTYGGIGSDSQGNIYALYHSDYSGNRIAYLIKYNSSGVRQWVDTLQNVVLGALAVDAAGNCYVACTEYSAFKMVLVKFDSNGNRQFTEYYASSGSSTSTSPYIVREEGGKVYIMAASRESGSSRDCLIMKFDATSGNLDWKETLDTKSSSLVGAIGMDAESNGDLFVFGSSGSSDFSLAQFNSSGSEVWKTTKLGRPGKAFARDASGNLFTSYSGSNMYTVEKHSPSGNVLKSEDHSSSDFIFPNYLRSVGSELLVVGYMSKSGGQHAFTALLDQDLKEISRWISPESTGSVETGSDLGADRIVTGSRQLKVSRNIAHIQVWKPGMISSIDPQNLSSFKAFPNPANSQLIISNDGVFDYRIAIYDINGRLCQNLRSQDQYLTLDVSVWPRGIYLLKIQGEKFGAESLRIVVE